MKPPIPLIVAIVGGAVGIGLAIATMAGALRAAEQPEVLAVGQLALGVGMVALAGELLRGWDKK